MLLIINFIINMENNPDETEFKKATRNTTII